MVFGLRWGLRWGLCLWKEEEIRVVFGPMMAGGRGVRFVVYRGLFLEYAYGMEKERLMCFDRLGLVYALLVICIPGMVWPRSNTPQYAILRMELEFVPFLCMGQ